MSAYVYNTIDESIKVVDAKSKIYHLFNFDDTVYYYNISNGLYNIENGKGVLVSDDSRIKEVLVLGINPIEKQTSFRNIKS